MTTAKQAPTTDNPRRAAREALCELLGMLAGPLPGLPAPPLLCDRTPDPGLFGPASITWRLASDPLLLLGGGRALLMQVAHPLVAQGVVDHSDYDVRPFDRLLETVRWLVLVIFGTTAEAEAAIRNLYEVHTRVAGTLDAQNATAAFPAGTPYSANDPVLARWVLATIVESMLVSQSALLGPLAAGQEDRFVREWRCLGRRMGIADGALWNSAAELRAYVRREIASGRVSPVPGSLLAARPVLRAPLPWPATAPLAALLGFMTLGLLPEPLRSGFGAGWTPAKQRLHRWLCTGSRAVHRVLPRRLRVSPLYDLACNRVLGRAPLPTHQGGRQ